MRRPLEHLSAASWIGPGFLLVWLLAPAPAFASQENRAQADASAPTVQELTLPDDTFARDLAALPFALRGEVRAIQHRLRGMGSDLRLVALIPGLEQRAGAFQDIDGDGDIDYLATEMIHGQEEVHIHLNQPKGWRRSDKAGGTFNQKHPLGIFVLEDDGSGAPAVVLPVGWPPYLYLLATDGRGRFRGEPRPLGEHLPPRVSRPMGVDNCPYTTLECEPATDDAPARIHGLFEDQDAVGRPRTAKFTLELLRDGRVRSRVLPDERPVVGSIPRGFHTTRSHVACEHESSERRAILAHELRDLDGDGVQDLLTLSGVLSAHLFPGRVEDGHLSFGEERGRPRDVPIEDLRIWFPSRLNPPSEDSPYAFEARARLDSVGFQVWTVDGAEAALTLSTSRRKGWLLNYYHGPDGLIPVQDYRRWWPTFEHNHLSEDHRRVILLDADHDGSPDVLSIHIGEEYQWLKDPPKHGGFLPPGYTRDIRPGKRRAGLVHGLGERHDEANQVLALFPGDVELPSTPNAGYPITLEPVPVRTSTGTRERYCVFLRDRKLGLFFEVAPAPAQEVVHRRRLAAWFRRTARREEMRTFYWSCDDNACVTSGSIQLAIYSDSARLIELGLPDAATAEERASVYHRAARYYSRAAELARAADAYFSFAEEAQALEPLAALHPDLANLVADPIFKALHAQRSLVHPTQPGARPRRAGPGR